MRNFFSILMMAVFLWGCAENKTDTGDIKDGSAASTTGKDANINYPFTAAYSSSFEMGDAKNSKIVLDFWKAWQDDQFETIRPLLADTITILFHDGGRFHGSADSLIASGKAARQNYTSVTDSLDAWFSTKSVDKNEDWVCVWGREYTTDKKGKKDTLHLQEIWRLKDGKVNYVGQFAGKRN